MNVLVTGTRRLLDARMTRAILHAFYKNDLFMESGHLLVHGAAVGVDTFVAGEAVVWGWEICGHPADWPQYGRAAGPIRNQNMLVHHKDIELVLAFPAGDSKGTWDMVERAVKAHVPVRIYPL